MKVLVLSLLMSFSAFAGVVAIECPLKWEDEAELTFDFIISDVQENSKVFLTIPAEDEMEEPPQVTPLPIIGGETSKKVSTIAVGFFMTALIFEAKNSDLDEESGSKIPVKVKTDFMDSDWEQEITCTIL